MWTMFTMSFFICVGFTFGLPQHFGCWTFQISYSSRSWSRRHCAGRCRNALSTDWLPDEKAKTFPLRDYYSDLGWKKKVKRAMRDTSVRLKRIHDIFNNDFEEGGINVAVIGNHTTTLETSLVTKNI